LRGGTTASDLASQIALIDAARAALAGGDSARALASVRDYQSGYPNGSFKPEVAAIKIEALLKLGRKTEARALAERFSANYGPGPLTDRVTRLLGAGQP
jgi:outer membrane protein assembly factor BamD (BamD/ComL family)